MTYYILGIISLLITAIAQIYISVTYSKYSQVKSKNKLSGFETAKKILEKNNLEKLYVVETQGVLTDHYDPRAKVVRLSHDIFNGDSISSIAVAAHECGHAIQDKNKNKFMRIRSFLVPFVNFSTKMGYIVVFLGAILGIFRFIYFGIILLMIVLLFQLVTLPVEIGASRDALKYLKKYNILTKEEVEDAKKVLTSAALTYVASLASTIIEVLRLLSITNND
jgi:uncharacterized protein